MTFLAEKPKKNLSLIKNTASLSGFEIANLDDLVAYSLVPKDSKTADFMKFLDVEFGKNVTTRNWNTIQKIILELEKRL